MLPLLAALLPTIAKTIGSVVKNKFPDSMSESEKASAEMAVKQAIMEHESELLETQMSAIVAEAKSKSFWTSGARPGFLWLMYLIIVVNAIIAPLLGIFFPAAMSLYFANVVVGLNAIPSYMWGLFTTGFLGYVGAREFGKTQILKGKK